jgi:hypothetical protein
MGVQITEKLFWKRSNVGGNDNVPPTYCLRSVYISAYAAAYAEATGRPESGGIALRQVLGRVG